MQPDPQPAPRPAATDSRHAVTFTQAYTKHARFVRAVLRRSGVPDAVIEDAEQDVFIAAYRGLPKFEGRSAITTWLFRIAVRVASRHRRRPMLTWDPVADRLADPDRDPEVAARQREGIEIVDRCLRRLDDDKWMVFVLAEIDGRTAGEIASLLGIAESTVYTRLHRARKVLRRELDRSGKRRPFWAAIGWPFGVRQQPVTAMGSVAGSSVVLAVIVTLIAVAVWLAWSHRHPSRDATSSVAGEHHGPAPLASRLVASRDPDEATARWPFPPPSAAVTGTVYDADSDRQTTIAGANVCLWPTRGAAVEQRDGPTLPTCARTNDEGHYSVDTLASGDYIVVISANGYAPKLDDPYDRTALALRRGETRKFDAGLRRGGAAVTGIVRDLDGAAVVGAKVLLQRASPRGAYATRDAGILLTTDDDGRFAGVASPGHLTVWAEAEGYAWSWQHVHAPSGSTELVLMPGSSITGTVTWHETGEPVHGARVTATEWGSNAAVSDEHGRFALHGLEPGRLAVAATHPDGESMYTTSVTVDVAQRATDVAIQVTRGHTVHARVEVIDGERSTPCPRGWVQLLSIDASTRRRTTRQAPISEDGRVTLGGVLDGSYRVHVTCDHAVVTMLDTPLWVDAAIDDPITWSIAAGVAVRGQLRHHDGVAAVDTSVQIVQRRDSQSLSRQRVWVDEEGSFVFTGVAPGTYAISIGGRTFDDPTSLRLVDVEDRDIDEISLVAPTTGTIVGRLLGDDEVPIAGALIISHAAGEAMVVSDDNGGFELAHARVGTHELSAERSGELMTAAANHETTLARVTVRANEVSSVTLVADAWTSMLRGSVIDDAGTPVANAIVHATEVDDIERAREILRDATHWFGSRRFVMSDAQGRFELAHVPARTHGLRAFLPDRSDGIALAAAGDSIEIEVQRAARLVLAVREPDGSPAQSVAFRALEPHVDERLASIDGSYTLDGLATGRIELDVWSPSGSNLLSTTLISGETVALAANLAAHGIATGRLVDESGQPIAGATVQPAGHLGLASGSTRRSHHDLSSGSNGRFTVHDVASGRTMFHVRTSPAHEGLAPRVFFSANATPGDTTDLGDILIPRDRLARGQARGIYGMRVDPVLGSDISDDRFVISDIEPGSAADAASLRAGDIIVAINGVDVTGRDIYLADWLLRGPADREVELTLANGEVATVRPR